MANLLQNSLFLIIFLVVFDCNYSLVNGAIIGLNKQKINVTYANAEGPFAKTEYGPLRGVYITEEKEAIAFLGIPYASPPVGDLRWQPPQKMGAWDGEFQATRQPVGCPQNCGDPTYACPPGTDEDCLYLNVYTPRDANENSNLPVMLFFHGGNFQSGGAGGQLYDGRFIANMSEVVVVVINYRLSALGFMVTSGSDDRLKGNYGFMDQQAAMRFVKSNIAGFGGNPNLVTLFGQSAGAQSIACHLISEESSLLFHQAISESNPFTIPFQTPTRGAALGNLTAELLGCKSSDIKCLKSKSAEEVLQKGNEAAGSIIDVDAPLQSFEPWNPTIDGDVVPMDPLPAFVAGKFQRKPMIIGTTSEEGVLYIYGIWGETPAFIEAYAFLVLVFKDPDTANSVIKAYDIQSSDDLREPLSAGCTDYIFGCSSRNATRLAHFGGAPVYHYIFDHAFSFEDGWGPNPSACKGRVCHGGDLPFVFHTATLGGFNYRPSELRLTNSIVSYFGNFAHTGDPNNGEWSDKPRRSYEHWPEYTKTGDWPSMILKTPRNQVHHKYREEKCNMWDSIGYEESDYQDNSAR